MKKVTEKSKFQNQELKNELIDALIEIPPNMAKVKKLAAICGFKKVDNLEEVMMQVMMSWGEQTHRAKEKQ